MGAIGERGERSRGQERLLGVMELWLLACIQLSKLVELYTKNDGFYCM